MLPSRPTLIFKLLTPHLPTLYILPLPSHHRLLLLAVFLQLRSFSHLTLSGFCNGMLEVFKPGAMNYFTFFCPILSTLSTSRNPILTHLPFFQIPGFSALRSDRTHFRSGILSRDATHASGGVIIFVRQGLFFSELFTSPLSLPDPRYSDYVGINIFPNNSSSLSFLNVYALLFALFQQITVPTSFLLPFFPPPEIFSFWGTSTATTTSGIQEVLPTPDGRQYSTASSLLSSSLSMTLTHPPSSTAPLAVAPPMKSPMLPLLLSFLALARCFRTSVLITYQFFYPSLSLWSFAPTSVPFLQFLESSLE